MVVVGCLPARRGVAGGRGGCPRPIGGFAGDEASTACARCRLSRRYGGRCRLQTTGRRGFLGAARRVTLSRWESCGGPGTGGLAARRLRVR